MTLPKFALRYRKCRLEELEGFIKSRTGSAVPEGQRSKKEYIDILQKLDENLPVFRFMDLPAEMRVLIYEFLLTRDKSLRRLAYTGILRTSKEVHREAIDVLRSESAIRLNVSLGLGARVDVEVNIRHLGPWTDPYPYTSETPKHWLHSLPSVRRLHVRLDNVFFAHLHHAHLALGLWDKFANFLAETFARYNDLLELKLTFRPDLLDGCEFSAALLAKMVPALRSLRGLPENCTLDIEGLAEDDFERVWRMINST